MENSGLCLQYFIGMGNFPRNCQYTWMKLEIGNFEKIVFGNLWYLTESLKMFVNVHLELSKDGFAIFVGGRMPELKMIVREKDWILAGNLRILNFAPPRLGHLAPASEVAGRHTLPF
jgi:hypothetical protein